MIKPEYDSATLFRAVAVEELPPAPARWPNDKQLVVSFQQPDPASVHACMAALELIDR
jgi:hypothetical protein